MALYQPSSLEQSLIKVNHAADLAWASVQSSVFIRLQCGDSIDGAIPEVSLEAAQRRAKLGDDIHALLATVDDDALPHEFALTAKLLRYYAGAWSKDAERYWVAYDILGQLFYAPFAQTGYSGGYAFSQINGALAGLKFEQDG